MKKWNEATPDEIMNYLENANNNHRASGGDMNPIYPFKQTKLAYIITRITYYLMKILIKIMDLMEWLLCGKQK